mmetsp:Transcript_24479/g.68072  ORF Transcript_24479/g.68072 Transcript_24479/m.68072 type:complete len:592 (-) Transcript_24479:903-2678(-)
MMTNIATSARQGSQEHMGSRYEGSVNGSDARRAGKAVGRELSSKAKGFPIFLTSGGRTKRVEWAGKSFEELAKVYFQVFSVDKDRIDDKIRRGHFYLKHDEFGVFFEGFELSELAAGSVIEVRGPHALEPGAAAWEVDPDPTGSVLSMESEEHGSDSDSEDRLDISSHMDAMAVVQTSDSTGRVDQLRNAVWRTLEDPSYSRLAQYITIFVMIVILVSTAAFIAQTLPMFQSADQEDMTSAWYALETACIIVFTVEFALRLLCAPARLLSFRPLNLSFFLDFMNMIDLVAIIPYYVELGFSSSRSVPGLAILRVVRLVRIFRLFKVSKGAATIFLITMKKSAKPLYMLIFFTSLALTIFSSLMYYAERGEYDQDLGVWKRVLEYICDVDITVLPPAGEAVQVNATGGEDVLETYYDSAADWLMQLGENELHGSDCRSSSSLRFLRDDGNGTAANVEPLELSFSCYFPYRYRYDTNETTEFDGLTISYRSQKQNCVPIFEVSPFESIPATMWWCLVTMTTVGYGDMYPIRWYGRMLGMVVMLSGILVIALPITVIGSNFADVYAQMEMRKAEKMMGSQGVAVEGDEREMGGQ